MATILFIIVISTSLNVSCNMDISIRRLLIEQKERGSNPVSINFALSSLEHIYLIRQYRLGWTRKSSNVGKFHPHKDEENTSEENFFSFTKDEVHLYQNKTFLAFITTKSQIAIIRLKIYKPITLKPTIFDYSARSIRRRVGIKHEYTKYKFDSHHINVDLKITTRHKYCNFYNCQCVMQDGHIDKAFAQRAGGARFESRQHPSQFSS